MFLRLSPPGQASTGQASTGQANTVRAPPRAGEPHGPGRAWPALTYFRHRAEISGSCSSVRTDARVTQGSDAGSGAAEGGDTINLHRARPMTKGRLEAFSDGVIAIIITIMVLELKVPHGGEGVLAPHPKEPVYAACD